MIIIFSSFVIGSCRTIHIHSLYWIILFLDVWRRVGKMWCEFTCLVCECVWNGVSVQKHIKAHRMDPVKDLSLIRNSVTSVKSQQFSHYVYRSKTNTNMIYACRKKRRSVCVCVAYVCVNENFWNWMMWMWNKPLPVWCVCAWYYTKATQAVVQIQFTLTKIDASIHSHRESHTMTLTMTNLCRRCLHSKCAPTLYAMTMPCYVSFSFIRISFNQHFIKFDNNNIAGHTTNI